MTAFPLPEEPRFSDEELIDIIDATRQRSTVTRHTGPDHDRVDVPIRYMPGCAYRFERDKTGWSYFLLKSPGEELKLVVAGTLEECLGMLRTNWS